MADQKDLDAFVTQVTRPEDFDDFWERVLAGLAEIPLEPSLSPDPMRSNAEVDGSRVHYRSLDGLEISGWYCVPTEGDGPFPPVIRFPGYKGEPGLRRDWGRKEVVTLTVAVRALAMKELTPTNAARVIGKEALVGLFNGVMFAGLIGVVAWLWFGSVGLGVVIGLAMIVNMFVAGLAGTTIPLALDRMGIDPAVASSVFLTTLTDVVGFFVFLGLAALLLF